MVRCDASSECLSPRRDHISPKAERLQGLAVLALLVLAACTATYVRDGFLIDEARGFRIPMLLDGWRRIEAEGVELAFRAEPGNQVAALFLSCKGEQAIPLRILARRLFFGIGEKRIVAQESISLDGTEAIHTLLEGRLEKSDVMVSSYTVKDSKCVYDLVYVAAPASFQERLPDFERFVKGWTFTTKDRSGYEVPGSKEGGLPR